MAIKPIRISDNMGDRRRSSVATTTCAYPASAAVCKRLKVTQRDVRFQDQNQHRSAKHTLPTWLKQGVVKVMTELFRN